MLQSARQRRLPFLVCAGNPQRVGSTQFKRKEKWAASVHRTPHLRLYYQCVPVYVLCFKRTEILSRWVPWILEMVGT